MIKYISDDSFEYTPEGCVEAIEYLKSIDRYSEVRRLEGWTIIGIANSLKKSESNIHSVYDRGYN